MNFLPKAVCRLRIAAAVVFGLGCAPLAVASVYDLPPPGSDVVGQIQHIHTKASDTFVKLAREYDVGYRALQLANPNVDPWLPGDGTPLIIPSEYVLPNAPRRGIVINIPEMRLYYYPPPGSPDAGKVYTFPIGVGRQGWATPVAETHVAQKIPHPSWTPTASIKKEHAERGEPLPDVVPAGPDNPLGQYALRLAIPDYLIHGTNKPDGVGMRVSHGCIRLFAPNIEKLFSMVKVGTPVDIVSQPYEVGWDGNTLVMAANPPDGFGDGKIKSYTPWVSALVAATANHPNTPVDWNQAQQVAEQTRGIPLPIGGADTGHSADETDMAGVSGSGASHTAPAQKTSEPRSSTDNPYDTD